MLGPARVRNLLLAGVVTASTGVVAGSVASAGPVTDGSTDNGVVVERVPAPEREAALEYWTPERLAAAQPLEVSPPAGIMSEPAPQGLANFATKVKKPYTKAKKRVTGAVFGTLPGSFGYRCSGTAVQGQTELVVWTAGHCVYNAPDAFTCTDPPDEDPGPCEPNNGDPGYVQNLVFIPGYKAGDGKTNPFGKFPAVAPLADERWIDIGNFRYDFAAFTVGNNKKGQALDDVLDPRQLVTGYGLEDSTFFNAIGYPARSPFNGNAQWKCASEMLGQDAGIGELEAEAYVIGAAPIGDPNPGLPGEDPLRIMCDMTGGSSGGGWRLSGAIGSNVSYGYGANPVRLFGPYLGADALALLNTLT